VALCAERNQLDNATIFMLIYIHTMCGEAGVGLLMWQACRLAEHLHDMEEVAMADGEVN
jgi:hypothetical protein